MDFDEGAVWRRRRAVRLVLLLASLLSNTVMAADLSVVQVVNWTGPRGDVGWGMHVGAQVAFDDANANAVLGSNRIRLITADQERSVDAQVKSLVRESSAFALFGFIDDDAVRHLSQERTLQELNMPLVAVNSNALSLHRLDDPHVVLTRPSLADELAGIFRQLSSVQQKRVVLVVPNDGNATETTRAAAALASGEGLSIVSTIRFDSESTPVQGVVSAVLARPHDAVVLALGTQSTALFCKSYRGGGGNGQLASVSTAEATRVADLVGKAATRGLMFSLAVPNPRDRRNGLTREFLDAFTRFGPAGVPPTLSMFEAYIAARIVIEGLRTGRGPNASAALSNFLAKRTYVGIAGVNVPLRRSGVTPAPLTMLDSEGRFLW